MSSYLVSFAFSIDKNAIGYRIGHVEINTHTPWRMGDTQWVVDYIADGIERQGLPVPLSVTITSVFEIADALVDEEDVKI